MARGYKYRHDARQYVALALQTMIENLDMHLKVVDSVANELDTMEEHRKLDEELEMNSSDEEIASMLEDSRDETIAKIGHIQRRTEELKLLKKAFESKTRPADDAIASVCAALHDSIVFEAMKIYGFSPEPNTSTWKPEMIEQLKREKYSIHMYAQALMLGFGVMPRMRWHLFPFDDL
jgi:hypothetical protein